MSWDPATDSNQPGGLSYNLRVGTAPGMADILNPMADLASGRRKVPRLGNAQENLRWTITNLAAGTYYWSVQTVDNSYAGSPFAPEMSFVRGSQPAANPQFIVLPEDTSRAITMTGSDPGGRSLTYSVLNQPAYGTLSGAPPNLVYHPNTNFFGADSFAFRVNNGLTDSTPARVEMAVIQVEDVAGASLSIRQSNNQITLSFVGEP